MIVEGVDPNLPEDERTLGESEGAAVVQHGGLRAKPGRRVGQRAQGLPVGPGYWVVDLAFSRNVPVGNGRRIELRVEAFNLFDTVNWANPNVTLNSNTQGRVTNTSGDPRIMQFAVKYNF